MEARPLLDRHDSSASTASSGPRSVTSAMLAGATREIVGSRELEPVLDVACRSARRLVGADGATFALREDDVVHYAAEDAIAPLWAGQRVPITRCVPGWVMLESATAVIEDVYADARIPVEAYRSTFVRSLTMVPVRRNAWLADLGFTGPPAAIGVYWGRPHRSDAEEVSLLETFADIISVALVNAQLYAEAKAARRAAEEATRARDLFLATLSHELRTPLAPIVTWARLLRDGRLSREKAREAIESIERCARTQARLIDGLLDVASISAGKLELRVAPVDLERVLAGAIQVVRPAAEAKGIALHVPDEPNAVMVRGDADRLLRALWNVLSNAVKFTPRGGQVTVTVRAGTERVEVSVADNG